MSKLNDEQTIERYLQAIRLGAKKRHAAAYAGVAESTVREWFAKASKEDAEVEEMLEEERPAPSPHQRFVEKFEAARAECLVRALANVNRAGTNDWRAARYLLEQEGYVAAQRVEIGDRSDLKPWSQIVLDEPDEDLILEPLDEEQPEE